MSKLTSRIERMEAKQGNTAQVAARIAEDADMVRKKLQSLAAGLAGSDAEMTGERWAASSPAFRVAWAMRFAGRSMDGAIATLFLQNREGAEA